MIRLNDETVPGIPFLDDILDEIERLRLINENLVRLLDDQSHHVSDIVKMSYAEYLETPHWKTVSEEAKKRAGYRCQLCSATDRTLNTHHNNYHKLGQETMQDVIVLCEDCHARHHNKEVKYAG